MISRSHGRAFGGASQVVQRRQFEPNGSQRWAGGPGCLANWDEPALARPFHDGGEAGQAVQRMVVSSSQGIAGFCAQRGKDDLSDARQEIAGTVASRISNLGIFLVAREGFREKGEMADCLGDLAIRFGRSSRSAGLKMRLRRLNRFRHDWDSRAACRTTRSP